jgi:RimJ/RimL family protein N-acetyltransferase
VTRPGPTTPAVRLVPVDPDGARRIRDGGCPDGLRPVDDYPDEGDQVAAGMFLQHLDAVGDPRPYGHFVITVPDEDGSLLAVGGIGFHGPPDAAGAVEIGYAVAPSWRRRGIASAGVAALIAYARDRGAVRLLARVDPGNDASVAVLLRNGFASVTSGSAAAADQVPDQVSENCQLHFRLDVR